MRILILTDSLSLPRKHENQIVKFEETYPFLLRERYKDSLIVVSAVGGATIKDIYKQIYYYKYFEPDLVFVQVGIVDCAPRAWRKLGRKLISLTGLKLKKLAWFMRKYRGLRLTSPKEFNKYAVKIKNDFAPTPVYALTILPACESYEKMVPGITESIIKYNQILSVHFEVIDNNEFKVDWMLNDFHHLNPKGHGIIFNKISKVIDDFSNKV